MSEETAAAAAESGEAVTLPMPAVETTKEDDAAAVVTVSTGSTEAVPVTVPVNDITPGTVAVIVNEDGSETVVTTSIPTEEGLQVELEDGQTVKVVDKSMDFDDVSEEDWESDAVAFASARGIITGTSTTNFSPDMPTTRGQMMTILARLDGVDTTGGENWYDKGVEWAMANGISDGTNPEEEITREQMVTMLWRYLGKPESSHDLGDYSDADQVSDWAATAKAWAVENGIIQGSGNGRIDPKGDASRNQIAQVLMNLLMGA